MHFFNELIQHLFQHTSAIFDVLNYLVEMCAPAPRTFQQRNSTYLRCGRLLAFCDGRETPGGVVERTVERYICISTMFSTLHISMRTYRQREGERGSGDGRMLDRVVGVFWRAVEVVESMRGRGEGTREIGESWDKEERSE